MRKLVFIKAWELVKRFELNLSQALQLAWKEIKANFLFDRINYLDCQYMTSEQRSEYKEKISMANKLMIEIKNIMPVSFVPYSVSMNGAQAWYDGKTFNND